MHSKPMGCSCLHIKRICGWLVPQIQHWSAWLLGFLRGHSMASVCLWPSIVRVWTFVAFEVACRKEQMVETAEMYVEIEPK